MRAVFDANVLVSALLSPGGAPAQILSRWLVGEFELVVSERLLAELRRSLSYPKLSKQITAEEAESFVDLLREMAERAEDPPRPPRRSRDPGDDYLLALAEAARAVVVSGDQHLLELADRFPVRSPREFIQALDSAQ